ncbi:VacJ family lipoprotein [uncultured Roseobacter sp.]|uniref:MlaA family lipoprotein n=1 Tax=uncultured Roseobacter sp. TaxID=114847 RepID=UPI0026214F11|nr:VacJ family lipoprotein [uncultured Roseobacter sp.]
MPRFPKISAFKLPIIALSATLLLGACATTQDVASRSDGINDPYERQNRKVHAFNKGLDKNLIRPVAEGYGVVPVEIRNTVNNFSENLSMPGVAVNSLLQGDLKGTGLATLRFAMNTTLGLGGFFDPASELNIPDHDTDFGETLAVWGVQEGAYIELPLFGPSTQRATAGLVVDFFTNPLTYSTIDGDDRIIPPTARGAAALNDRERFGDSIDALLYESADSYAQARQTYLQNRRFELDENAGEGVDPYSADPYEDPYAQ